MNIEKRHSERRQDTFTNAMLNISSPNKKKTLYTFLETPSLQHPWL
jgi:reverse gyrase